MLKFFLKSSVCDGQGADRRAILSGDRSCLYIHLSQGIS